MSPLLSDEGSVDALVSLELLSSPGNFMARAEVLTPAKGLPYNPQTVRCQFTPAAEGHGLYPWGSTLAVHAF
jgi:hypothetical protein